MMSERLLIEHQHAKQLGWFEPIVGHPPTSGWTATASLIKNKERRLMEYSLKVLDGVVIGRGCNCRPGMDGGGVYHQVDCPRYLS